EWTCELEGVPGIRGRVTANGEPVPGAKVALHEMSPRTDRIEHNGFLTRLQPTVVDSDTTAGDGSFQLFAKDAGAHAILGTLGGYAAGALSPIDVDPRRGIDGLALALTRGGAIEGHVKLAARRDPTGVVAAVDRADSCTRTQRVGPDGTFRFEHLTPGRWRVT